MTKPKNYEIVEDLEGFDNLSFFCITHHIFKERKSYDKKHKLSHFRYRNFSAKVFRVPT